MDRRCPTCNTFKDESLFDEHADGSLHRDCIPCEEGRAKRNKAITSALPASTVEQRGWDGEIGVDVPRQFPGVDIDRIHYLRGAVRHKKKAA